MEDRILKIGVLASLGNSVFGVSLWALTALNALDKDFLNKGALNKDKAKKG